MNLHCISLSLICLVAMLSPGPDFVLITNNSLRYPRHQAFATAAGVVCGCFLHATACILGLTLILTKSVILYSIIKLTGACYLMYLGIRELLNGGTCGGSSATSYDRCIDVKTAFTQGLCCNLLNPKLALFLLSLFTQFIGPDALVVEKIKVGLVFVVEAALFWPALVVCLQRNCIVTFLGRFQFAISRIFGGTLLILGIHIALRT